MVFHSRRWQVADLEETVRSRDDEIEALKAQLEEAQLEAAAASLTPSVVVAEMAAAAAAAHNFEVGERGWMLNPHFTDGTRLRISPAADAEFTDGFVLNDTEVEILENADDFSRVRAATPPPPEDTATADGAAPAAAAAIEGWVRTRNITKRKRGAGLAIGALRGSYNQVVVARQHSMKNVAERQASMAAAAAADHDAPAEASGVPAAAADSAAPVASDAAPAVDVGAEGSASEASAAAATAAAAATPVRRGMSKKEIDDLSDTVASELRASLGKANLRTMELFRDCDIKVRRIPPMRKSCKDLPQITISASP